MLKIDCNKCPKPPEQKATCLTCYEEEFPSTPITTKASIVFISSISIIFIILMIYGIKWYVYKNETNRSQDIKTENQAHTPFIYTTKDGYVGCFVKDDFDAFVKYGSVDDKQAQMKMINSSRCIFIKAGIKCYKEENSWPGAVKIRPQGQTITLWTYAEAIK